MILTTRGRYAVMALVDMVQAMSNNKPVCLADIAERQSIALAYLEQIFACLKKHNVVKSVRGPGGGYLLVKVAAELTIEEVISASEEKLKITLCSDEPNQSCIGNDAKCVTHELWEGLENHMTDYLSSISLADVAYKETKTYDFLGGRAVG